MLLEDILQRESTTSAQPSLTLFEPVTKTLGNLTAIPISRIKVNICSCKPYVHGICHGPKT